MFSKRHLTDSVLCTLGFDSYDVNFSGYCRFVQNYNLERCELYTQTLSWQCNQLKQLYLYRL